MFCPDEDALALALWEAPVRIKPTVECVCDPSEADLMHLHARPVGDREVASCTSLSVWKRANNFEAVDAYCARRVLKSGRTCVETAYENDVEHVDHAELIERSLADQYFHA